MLTRNAVLTLSLVFLVVTCACFLGCSESKVPQISEDTEFVDSLLATLTLEDKVGEMTQLTLGAIGTGLPSKLTEPQHLDSAKVSNALVKYRVGSILNCGNHSHSPEKWHEFINDIQTAAAKKASGIPVLYGIDAIHGPTYTQNLSLIHI